MHLLGFGTASSTFLERSSLGTWTTAAGMRSKPPRFERFASSHNQRVAMRCFRLTLDERRVDPPQLKVAPARIF